MAMRSAKMKAITPPKLMPPPHRAAASGTLPIEHTQLATAMNGPTMAFSSVVQKPWPWRNRAFQHVVRHQHGQQAGHRVADDQLLAQHGDVGHRVARGVRPGGRRPQLGAPRLGLELVLSRPPDTPAVAASSWSLASSPPTRRSGAGRVTQPAGVKTTPPAAPAARS